MRDIDQLIAELSVDEKALLTTGASMWTTHGIERVGIPSVTVTDGPAGARGPTLPGIGPQVPTLCIPCGSALGATFDVDLLHEIGDALGHQTRTRGARVLLAPTVNLHRSPLSGRNFECYSEDPLLSGRLAAAFIRGVQSHGVATTVKHLVGNETEFERMTIDTVIDERTLREVYLLPFELAVRDGRSLGIMTSYNRVNGAYCTESRWLLEDIVRREWGFEGFFVTDWFAGATTEIAARAGLDLEMPAPPRAYGKVLADAVKDGRVDEADLDRAVRTLLHTYDRLGALDDEPMPSVPVDLPEHRELARRAAAGSIVLLRNETVDGSPLLPLAMSDLKRVAVIGPNAERVRIMGGGSAEVRPHHRTPILATLISRLGESVDVRHVSGGSIDKTTPMIDPSDVVTDTGSPGFFVRVFDGAPGSGIELTSFDRPDGRLLLAGRNEPGVPTTGFHFTADGLVSVSHSGDYTVSLVQVSPCTLSVDGQIVIDGVRSAPPRGEAFFGMGSEEMTAVVRLEADRLHRFVLECDAANKQWVHGAQIGLALVEHGDPVDRAVELARTSDVAVVVVGTTNDWESEGHNRRALDLPGRQEELIRKVAAVNPRTIVLVNTGAPVSMDWAEDVPAALQIWFGGQEMGSAVADVLFGDQDPGGRLPTTIPERIEHTPSFGNFPGEHGQIRYGEGLLIGHRWYEARHLPVRFPFGHGLSYASFDIGEPRFDRLEIMTNGSVDSTESLSITVPVTNTSDRAGSHVVQIYVSPVSPAVHRPPQELKAFAKVHLDAGQTTEVALRLDPRDFAYWDPGDSYRIALQPQVTGERSIRELADTGRWAIDPGLYEIRVASSSATIDHVVTVTIHKP
ncbi:MAG: glycoside hydrolase family 3 protein [Actinomycetota bacterium]